MTDKPQQRPAETTAKTEKSYRVTTVYPVDAMDGTADYPAVPAEGVVMTEAQLAAARQTARDHGVRLSASEVETP